MKREVKVLVAISGTVILLVLIGLQFLRKEPRSTLNQSSDEQSTSVSPAQPFGELGLPFDPKDLGNKDRLFSPFGVVRHSRDTANVGHGGIDFPLSAGDPIYAVADGAILKKQPADGGNGSDMLLTIAPGSSEGEAWIFKYEHIDLAQGIDIGTRVTKGQRIATSTISPEGNNHLELSYVFNNHSYFRNHTCWVDYLEPIAKQKLEATFNELASQSTFKELWQTAKEEEKYSYRGLLDTGKYPKGPQLCYPPGTDARVAL
ncbi:M23 family metallopeptidase [Candidatus Berkelbacteria bacterium]|nr:M23 family metallopeptidase [Candidatus Berkelbacteria bacterium]